MKADGLVMNLEVRLVSMPDLSMSDFRCSISMDLVFLNKFAV